MRYGFKEWSFKHNKKKQKETTKVGNKTASVSTLLIYIHKKIIYFKLFYVFDITILSTKTKEKKRTVNILL